MKIKKGDTVRIIAGKEKGKSGKVMQVLAGYEKVVVEGAMETVKHIKSRGNQPGQRVNYNAPIHVSNVQLVAGSMTGRVGYKMIDKDGKKVKVRVVRKAKKSADVQ